MSTFSGLGSALSALAAHHLRAIPFESLGPFLGHGVDISPEALYEAADVNKSASDEVSNAARKPAKR